MSGTILQFPPRSKGWLIELKPMKFRGVPERARMTLREVPGLEPMRFTPKPRGLYVPPPEPSRLPHSAGILLSALASILLCACFCLLWVITP